MKAGTFSVLDDPSMRDAKGRPLPWLRDILAYRDWIEGCVRALHGGPINCGRMVADLLLLPQGDTILCRAHASLVEHYAPTKLWQDPVV